MNNFIDFKVTGLKETLDYFQLLAKDRFPFALAQACNSIAFKIKDAEQEEMKAVFDRPKDQTVRNIKVIKGRKENPGAIVRFNQIYDGDEYMVAEVEGGPRTMKKSEKRFGHYYVPAAGATIDDNGNMSGGQINKILQFLQQYPQTDAKHAKRSATAMRSGAASGVQYFKLEQKTNGLRPGIYQRVPGKAKSDRSSVRIDKNMAYVFAKAIIKQNKGGKAQLKELDAKTKSLMYRGIVPVVYFVNNAPVYKPVFEYFRVANKVISENWKQVMGDAVNYAIKTAK